MFDWFFRFLDCLTFRPGLGALPDRVAGDGPVISGRDQRAIDAVLEREGGYVDHPDDTGGPTHFGITLATLRAHRGVPVLASDVRDMDRNEAVEIYRQRYIKDPRLDLIQVEWLFNAIFDMSVNLGPKRSVLILQKSACTKEDGILGPITVRVANSMDPVVLKRTLLKQWLLHYGRITRGRPANASFIVGWLKRPFAVLYPELS